MKKALSKTAVRTADVTNPPIRLLAKIGSIIVHADELTGKHGSKVDAEAIRNLLDDGEICDWLRGLEVQYPGALPRKRRREICPTDREKKAGSMSNGRAGGARTPAKRRPSAKKAHKRS